MSQPRTVASLTIDALGQGARESRLRLYLFVAGGNLWIRIVAEHALVIDLAAGVGLIGNVVPRVHGPVAALFGIPGERKLLQSAGSHLVEIGPDMAARTHDKVYR